MPAETVNSQLHKFRVVPLAKGLEHPWSIAFLPNKDILITERAGRLRLYSDGRLDPKPIANVPKVVDSGQGGLFDVTLHPQFDGNQLLYLAYAARGQGGVHTRVTRFRYDAKAHSLADAKQIFDANPKAFGGRHFGGRMVFDRQRYLYITLGDRGDMDRAQVTSDHSGSVIRLRDDGRVPNDNPLRGKSHSKPEIYSFGHRNPQGMALHPQTGAIWTHEHGARGGDEINIIRPGRNYGWPVITHGIDYDGSKIGIGKSAPGMEQPFYYWVPSIAPAGMAFYTGDKFPKWRNSLFVGALRGETLVRLKLKGNDVVKEERLLQNAVGRVRDVRIGPDGFLYLATDDSDGRLLRLEPVK
ncbi:MAG: PQQ-dependent sugar dehydrogenase [Alphaproteobacteria bacterium]|nr:PQQ-dependent sugar dehydrogenase [Alphaproteobacteria bacterium]